MENIWNCWLVCQQNWIDAKQPLRCFNVIEDDAKSPEWIVSIVSASYEWVRQTCAEYTPQSRIKTHMLSDHIVTNCLTSALCYQGKTLYIFCTKFQNSKFSPASFSADNIKQQTQCFLSVNLILLWLPQWISGDLVETDWSVEQLTVSQWMRWAAGGREDWLSFDNLNTVGTNWKWGRCPLSWDSLLEVHCVTWEWNTCTPVDRWRKWSSGRRRRRRDQDES